MSRLYTRNSRGRQPLLSSPKISKPRESPDETYQDPGSRRHRTSRKYAAKVQQAKQRRAASTTSGSSAADMDGEDASDEDSESEDDEEPVVFAPSYKTTVSEAGRKVSRHAYDAASLVGSVDSMFGDYDDYYNNQIEDPRLSPDENVKRFESQVFADSDDDDDEAYRAVDEISDSEDENVEQYEEQQLLAALSEDDIPDEEIYLNQIDGLSAYGFGDESDATAQFPPSSRGSDGGVATELAPERHVRFDMESAHTFHLQLSSSPTIARALLPSALPEHSKIFGGPASARLDAHDDSTSEDSYDSDATDDCLPDEALQSVPTRARSDGRNTPLPSSPPATQKSSSKIPRRKGPPRGVFIDDGDKASGILDPTGKIMLITHPHLLGQEFARRYGNSPSNSPSFGFEELMDESDNGDTQDQASIAPAANTDIMLGSLSSTRTDPSNPGQPTGPHEAFYPAPGFEIGDYAYDPDDLANPYLDDDPELGEDVIQMEDVIKFDDSDDSDSDSPTSPIYMPPSHTKGHSLSDFGNHSSTSHLTNSNVTAFRQHADPSYTHLSTTAYFSNFPDFSTPVRPSRKRKATAESPYTSSHYNGVTPVQRMKDPNPPSTPDRDTVMGPRGGTKRRRLMTA